MEWKRFFSKTFNENSLGKSFDQEVNNLKCKKTKFLSENLVAGGRKATRKAAGGVLMRWAADRPMDLKLFHSQRPRKKTTRRLKIKIHSNI